MKCFLGWYEATPDRNLIVTIVYVQMVVWISLEESLYLDAAGFRITQLYMCRYRESCSLWQYPVHTGPYQHVPKPEFTDVGIG